MTGTNEKVRSLFLSALMVMSVVAMTVAFSGGAAAANNQSVTLSGTSNPDAPGETGVTYTIQGDAEGNQDTDYLTVDLDGANISNVEASDVTVDAGGTTRDSNTGGFSISKSGSTIDITLGSTLDISDGETVTVTINDVTNQNGGTYTATADLETTTQDDVWDTIEADYTISGESEDLTLRKATHYVDSGEGVVLEAAFNTQLESNTVALSDFNVTFENGTEKSVDNINGVDLQESGGINKGTNGRLLLNTSSTVLTEVDSLSVSGSVSNTGGYTLDEGSVDIRFAPESIVADGVDEDAYRGSLVAVEASSSAEIDIEGQGYSVVRSPGAGSNVYVFDTSNRELGDYNVTVGGTPAVLTLEDLGLGVTADATDVTNEDNITATVESNAINRPVDATLLNSDDEEVASTSVSIDSDGQAEVDLGTAETGEYTVEVEDVNTGVTASSDTINVSSAADSDVTFAGDKVFAEERGDIVDVTVEMTNTDTATIVVGSEEQNYYYIAEVQDDSGDGEVTLSLNTYLAGAGNISDTEKASVSEDDTLLDADEGGDFATQQGESNASPGDKLLGAVDYNANATVGENLNESAATVDDTESDDIATVSLRQRSTDNHQIWTAPSSVEAGDLSVSDVYASIGSSITQTDEITVGDYSVHQIQASGIEGHVSNQSGLLNAVGDGSELTLTVTETEDSVGPNADPKSISLTSDNTDVILDPANDTYFAIIDTSQLSNVETGENYNASFTVLGDGVLTSGSSNETVSDEFEVVERTASLDTNADDEVVVESASGQEITGTTSLAPGSEVTVRIQSQGTSSPFLVRPSATVQPDGTFSVTEDFSDVQPNTTLQLTVRQNGNEIGGSGEATFDGRVGAPPTASVTFSDQETDGTVTVDSATLSEGGFVVLHLNNASGTVVGNSSYLEAGSHEDIEIEHAELTSSATIVAMAHLDTNDNQVYEFGEVEGADGPYTNDDGSPVIDSASITPAPEDTDTPTPTETDTPTPTETDTPTPTETDTPTPTETMGGGDGDTTTTSTSGPGFGVVVSVLALLAAALLARRSN